MRLSKDAIKEFKDIYFEEFGENISDGEVKPTFEPKKYGLTERKMEGVYSKSLIVRREVDDVRTYIMSNLDYINITQFGKVRKVA